MPCRSQHETRTAIAWETIDAGRVCCDNFARRSGRRRSAPPPASDWGNDVQGTDKFLAGIVAGVVVLVVAVFIIALLRPNELPSQAGDTPEGVATSYLLAVQLMDYERAYGYLSPDLPGYPDSVDEFAAEVDETWLARHAIENDISLTVNRVRARGDRAEVSILHTWFDRGGLFDSGERTLIVNVDLSLTANGWRIVGAERYWNICWNDPNEPPCTLP